MCNQRSIEHILIKKTSRGTNKIVVIESASVEITRDKETNIIHMQDIRFIKTFLKDRLTKTFSGYQQNVFLRIIIE